MAKINGATRSWWRCAAMLLVPVLLDSINMIQAAQGPSRAPIAPTRAPGKSSKSGISIVVCRMLGLLSTWYLVYWFYCSMKGCIGRQARKISFSIVFKSVPGLLLLFVVAVLPPRSQTYGHFRRRVFKELPASFIVPTSYILTY
jgi:hypothetical protein